MSLDIKKGLSAPFMASKVGKPPMQCFVQESVALQRTQKPTTSIQNGMKTFSPSISHLFPPYSKCVCLICNVSAAIPKPPSGPQVKHFGWVDHVELVILKVALKSKKCGHPCSRRYSPYPEARQSQHVTIHDNI